MVTSVRSSPFRKAPSVERFAAAAERCPIEDGCPPILRAADPWDLPTKATKGTTKLI